MLLMVSYQLDKEWLFQCYFCKWYTTDTNQKDQFDNARLFLYCFCNWYTTNNINAQWDFWPQSIHGISYQILTCPLYYIIFRPLSKKKISEKLLSVCGLVSGFWPSVCPVEISEKICTPRKAKAKLNNHRHHNQPTSLCDTSVMIVP